MVQGYYTLEQAAQILGLSTEKLSQMAQKHEVRAFADRGSWRFRSQDIEEMARRLGRGSHPDLQLGEAKAKGPASPTPKSAAKSADSPPVKKPGKAPGEAGAFDFSVSAGDQVEVGRDITVDTPSARRKAEKAGISPSPKPGSDSDVKLVPDDSDVDFKINAADSDVKVKGLSPKPSKSPGVRKKTDGSPSPGKAGGVKKTGIGPVMDSGVRLVPMEDQGAAAPPKAPSDSDIRIEFPAGSPKPSAGEPLRTEEIDLDAELRKADEAARAKKPGSKLKPKTAVKPSPPAPGATDAGSAAGPKKPKQSPAGKSSPSSSDFEVKPQGKPDETLHYPASNAADDEVALGELPPTDLTDISGSSGINLSAPADSGIDLEKTEEGGGDKIEFELSLDEVEATPKPSPVVPEEDSSSEFELSLDVESTPKPAGAEAADDSSSEFELSLDVESMPKPAPAAPEDESSSEFELTLDDSGGLAPLEGEAGKDKDIFETDFEVPALEEESNSDAMALDDSDTALESSDFDLSVSEEASDSQVVALEDEEEADEEAATVARPAPVGAEEGEVDELLGEDELAGVAAARAEEEVEGAAVVAAAPASWGIMPAAVLVPCVIVMFLLTLMSLELVHSMWGYRQPKQPAASVVTGVAHLFGIELPTDSKK